MNIRTPRSTALGALRANLGLLLATVLVTGLGIAIAPTASAAPPAPAGLEAVNIASGTPLLRWERVPGATTYQVEVASSGAVIESATTTNFQFVPTKPLPVPTGTDAKNIVFRVKSVDASGTSAWSDEFSFESAAAAIPQLESPAGGAEFAAPFGVPQLRWSPVARATGYVVRVSRDEDFTDPTLYTDSTLKSTSFTFTPAAAGTFWWKVQAQYGTGIVGAFSEPLSFHLHGVPTIDTAEASPQHSENSGDYVEDAVFDWEPVAGAVSYDLQVDNDELEGDAVLFQQSGIVSTRFGTDLLNDQFYWRVRSTDAYGVKSDWSQYLILRRAWPRQPQLQWPPDQSAGDDPVGGPFYYQWEPIRLASVYEVQLATDASFQNIVDTCKTVHTTFVPTKADECWPTAGTVRYWRVKAYDSAIVTDLISADVHRFVYDTWTVSSLQPADGSSGDVPTLTWAPMAGASAYRVQVFNNSSGAVVEDVTTRTTAYTPRKNLLTNANNPVTYRWHVIPMSETRSGNGLLPVAQPRFTVTGTGGGDAASPEPTAPLPGTVHGRFPTLGWTPMPVSVDGAGKTTPPKYRVFVRPAGTLTWPTAPVGETAQPRFDDVTVNNLVHGDYEWKVDAVAGATTTTGATGTFTIGSLPAVTGQRVALQGSALWGDDASEQTNCARQNCEALPETPILAWDPSPNAGLYRVTISYDAELTNVVSTTLVEGTALLPSGALPDSQAGSPYFWKVQPCTTATRCTPLTHATYSFEKRSNQTQPTSPLGTSASPAEVADDVTLTWRDFYLTNLGTDSGAATGFPTTARIEASQYRVQISATNTFTSLLDEATVQRNQFTSPTKTYPEGPLYWRVQALDATGNALPWSDVQTLHKLSPVPQTTVPSAGGTVGNPAFLWDPLNYARSYDLEVYKNEDRNASPGNRVISASPLLPAYTHVDPLPVSATPYVWRVRRTDATGRKGGWSPMKSFTVRGIVPATEAPAPGSRIDPNGSLFTWSVPEGAPPEGTAPQPTSYRFEYRRPGPTSAITAIATVATKYAPTKPFADGSWEWRVVALDAKGVAIGASKSVDETWSGFTSTGAPVATAKPVIEGDGSAGSVLHALPATWDVPGVTEYWQWLRAGQPITDATSQDYTVTNLDVGKVITVRVTGQKAGYANGTVTSDPISGTVGPAPTSTTNPEITGPATVGSVLTLTPGEWSLPDVVESYQWYRGDTTAISKATGKTYTVALADVGQDIHVVVTGRRVGYTNAEVMTNKVRAVAADAPVVVTLPTISGTRSVGADLTATGGTWKTSSGAAVVPTFTYQWFRNGAPIPNATSSKYRLVTSDAGLPLNVRVTARVAGANDGVANSAFTTIAKLRSTAKVVATARVRTTQRATITITISASGIRPSGTLRLYDKLGTRAERQIKVVNMTTSAVGRVTIKMVLKGRGTHRLRATYGGSSTIAASRSASVRVIVQ